MTPLSRRSLLAGTAASAAAAGIMSVPAAVAATIAPADDSPLVELLWRYREIDRVIDNVNNEIDAMNEGLPSKMWTPEELQAHNVQHLTYRGFDEPREIDLKTIEVNNGWDDPRWRLVESESVVTETWEGTKRVVTMRQVHETAATPEEIAAWKARCAARRALYDAKEEAFRAAKENLDIRRRPQIGLIEVTYREREDILEKIRAYLPGTTVGAVEKMRFYRWYAGEFDGEPDDLGWSATLFLSALADLERLAGEPGSAEA